MKFDRILIIALCGLLSIGLAAQGTSQSYIGALNSADCDLAPVIENVGGIPSATTDDIYITGHNFSPSTTVTIASNTVNTVSYIAPDSLEVNLTSNATEDSYLVIVTNACGSDTSKLVVQDILCLVPDVNTAWQNVTANVVAGAGSLSANATNGWNKGASFGTVGGDFELEFCISGTTTNVYGMFGVSDTDPNASYTAIDYAIYFYNGGNIRVYENGVYRGAFGTGSVGDCFQIRRTSGVVSYHLNGAATPFYTSTINSTYDVVFDSSIYRNSSINNIQLCGEAP